MSNKQLIFDIETLGTGSSAVCLCASFLVYDVLEDYETPLEELRDRVKTFKLSVKDQKEHGRLIETSTLEFWKEEIKKEPSLSNILKPKEDDLTIEEFFYELKEWLSEQGYEKKNDWVWQRGTIDIMILDSMWKDIEVSKYDYPIAWWKVRDLRTAIDLLGDTDMNGYVKGIKDDINKFVKDFRKHDPVDDIILEVLQLRLIGLYQRVE